MDTTTDNEIQKELKTRFALLPEEIQKVVISSDYQLKLFEISKKYKLTYEQLGVLEMETTLVLIGMTHPKDYITDLSEHLPIKSDALSSMVDEIKKQVFDPIHTTLMGIYQGPTNESTETQEAKNSEIKKAEETILQKAGISINTESVTTVTPTVRNTENRQAMLEGIENPQKSNPVVLNEGSTWKQSLASSIPVAKSAVSEIPVPKAPYAISKVQETIVSKQATPATPPVTGTVSTPPKDIMSGKLGGTFAIPKKETDYTLKNIGGGDAYREPLE